MSRVEDIRTELLTGPHGEYEYWDEELRLVTVRKGSYTLEVTHLEVGEGHRGQGLASDGLNALEQVAAEEGFDYLEASVGATNEPDDGSQPGTDDPTALCLRKNGFREVTCRRSPRGNSTWGFTGYKPLPSATGTE